MSDMGRFVAAAIRDKTFSDLLEENDQLRAEKDQLRAILKDKEYAVEITGPNGTIYAFVDEEITNMCMKNRRACPAHLLLDLEVHIRGIAKVVSFREIAQGNWTFDMYTNCAQMWSLLDAEGGPSFVRPVEAQYSFFEAEEGGRDTFTSLEMTVYASREQSKVVYDVFDDPSVSTYKAFAECDWGGAEISFTSLHLSNAAIEKLIVNRPNRPPFH
jgi:hypothetical protein